jgi:hypothetical protein
MPRPPLPVYGSKAVLKTGPVSGQSGEDSATERGELLAQGFAKVEGFKTLAFAEGHLVRAPLRASLEDSQHAAVTTLVYDAPQRAELEVGQP